MNENSSILIVDDNPDNLWILTKLLEREGFEVRPALSGEVALQAVEKSLPDLILMDIRMPGIDGYETCRRLKSSEVTRRIPVIFLSAMHDLAERIASFKAGGVDYISKPFQDDELLARVRTHITLCRVEDLEAEVAARMESEAELLRDRQRLDFYVNNSPMATIEWDAGFEVTRWAGEAEKIFGWTAEETVGKPIMELNIIYEEDLPTVRNTIRQLSGGSKYVVAVNRNYTKDRRVIVCEWYNTVLTDSEGRMESVLSQVLDVTERKQSEEQRLILERQLLNAQKMESLGILAGGVAHDFNNILTSIIGNAELAMMHLNPESPVMENLLQIEKSSARAADLAMQMLAYSGKGRFLIETIDLNRLLEEMLHMLEISVSNKALLRFELHRPLPAVAADAAQIRQAVMNLVINASEAIGETGGIITIRTGSVDCDDIQPECGCLDEKQRGKKCVCLEISDTGCGMDKETVSRVFDPFFTTKFTGRGLGMSAVQGIVKGHNGAILVSSETGKGSCFRIMLPASGLMLEEPAKKPCIDEWKGAGKVLLVDDEEVVRDIGEALLMELGFSTVTAVNGKDGIDVYRRNPDVSFVILDLTMPVMGGEECFSLLKELNPEVKVIISSGYSEQEVMQMFAGKGLAGFIQKPYRISVLREAILKLESGGD